MEFYILNVSKIFQYWEDSIVSSFSKTKFICYQKSFRNISLCTRKRQRTIFKIFCFCCRSLTGHIVIYEINAALLISSLTKEKNIADILKPMHLNSNLRTFNLVWSQRQTVHLMIFSDIRKFDFTSKNIAFLTLVFYFNNYIIC